MRSAQTESLFDDLAHKAATRDTTKRSPRPTQKRPVIAHANLARVTAVERAYQVGVDMSKARAAQDTVEQARWAALGAEDRAIEIMDAITMFEARLADLITFPPSAMRTTLIIAFRARIAVFADALDAVESPFVL